MSYSPSNSQNLTSPPRPLHHPQHDALSVSSVLLPGPTTSDTSDPPSASSATTSFQIDSLSDRGLSPALPANRRADDIEMDAINPKSHRRRRSTLSAGLNTSLPPNGRGSRPRSTSIMANGDSSPKIAEEQQGLLDAKADPRVDDILTDEDLHDDEETGLTKSDKKRKRSRRRRNTRLDQRIVRDKLTDDERRQANQTIARRLAINAVLIGLWYIFSLSISLVRSSEASLNSDPPGGH